MSQTEDRSRTLREVAQRIEQIENRREQSNLAASTAILAGLVLDKEIIARLLRQELMRESVIYQEITLIFPTKRVLQSRGNPCDRIFKEAKRDGLTIEEVLEKYFPEDEEESDQAEEDKNVRSLHS